MHNDLRDYSGQNGIHAVSAHRMSAACAHPDQSDCWVVDEDALTIDVADVGTYTLMWTATEGAALAAGFMAGEGVLGETEIPERLALAVGFAFTEGIISGLQDIAAMEVCPERPDIVRMRLVAPAQVKVRRSNVLMTSSCGICGGRDVLEAGLADLPGVTDTLCLSVAALVPLMEAMQQRQAIYRVTGGTHAALVFSADQRIFAAAEDLGRHNALDKVIGKCLLQRKKLSGCGVVLSSRLSFEMIAKSARAGFEVVAAVSAPSSLAIAMAERLGITLCGFVRGECATVYTHPGRIRELAPASDWIFRPASKLATVRIR